MESMRDRLDAERMEPVKHTDLKSKLEAARQEIASLDDATIRVQQQLAESKEGELRAAAEAWAELCDAAAPSQLAALQSELVGYNTDSFGDVSLLVDHPTVLSEAARQRNRRRSPHSQQKKNSCSSQNNERQV